MNLLPILCSASGSPGQGSGCGSHAGHTWNAAEPHLLHAAASAAIPALLASGSARLVYCGLISSNASPGGRLRSHLLRWGSEAVEPPDLPALQHGDSHHPPTAPARHQVNSQDLQVAQGSEGSIFDAADLVVVQLPAERKGEDEGWLGAPGWGFPVTEVSLHPLAAPAQLPRCSGLLAAV